jgi:hypothetical protein
MVRVEVFTQPAALVPVTVYVVVEPTLHVTVAPVEALRPVAGDQLYVDAPLEVIDVEPPAHIEALTGVITTVGNGLTVMVRVAAAAHPAAFVPVMV